MTVPTLTAFSGVSTNGTQATSKTGGSVSWAAGDMVVVTGVTGGGATETLSVSNTGSGLAFTPVKVHNSAAADTSVGIWAAIATAASSGAVTMAVNQTSDMDVGTLVVHPASGETLAVGNSNLVTGKTTSPQTMGLNLNGPDSMIVWVAGDWSAGAVEAVTPTPTTHSTASPGPTALPYSHLLASQMTTYIDVLDDETATGSVTLSYTGASSGPFVIAAMEIIVTPAKLVHPLPRMPLGV